MKKIINRFACILACLMIAQIAIGQSVWTVSDHSHTISCGHDHGSESKKILKSSGPEDEFIPERGDRADDAVGLNILLLEGQASTDRENILFPRDREKEFIDGISGYLYDLPNAIVNSQYAPEDMPYIEGIHYLNFSSSTELMPEGKKDTDLLSFTDANEDSGENPYKTAILVKINELNAQGIEIHFIVSYLPFSGDLTPGAGEAKSSCDRSKRYLISYINSRFKSEDPEVNEFAEVVKGVSHEFGHNFELNHTSSDPINTCFDNYANYNESLKANSLMTGTNSVKSVLIHKDHFNSYYSKENAIHAISVFQSRNILPIRTCTTLEWYADLDSDGFVDKESLVVSCEKNKPMGFVENTLGDFDCNDNDDSINPNVNEIEGNDIDENCDGSLMRDGVSTDDREILYGLSVDPNPTYGPLILKLENEEKILDVLIFNSIGKKIMKYSNINNSETRLNVYKLQAGNYLLRIRIKNDVITKHIIKA